MSSGTRVFVVTTAILLGLIAVTFFIKPNAFEPTSEPPIEAKTVTPFTGRAPSTTVSDVPAAVAGAPALVAAMSPLAEDPEEDKPCVSCRSTWCTNYKGLGVNVVDGCFGQVDPSQGADPMDPTFLADCRALVECAREHHCALSKDGAAGCYCGSADINECIDRGPAADSPCLDQWRRATRSRDHEEITVRFSDLKYPAGWANFLIECDAHECKDTCAG